MDRVFLTRVLDGETIALEAIDKRYWPVWFRFYPLSILDASQTHGAATTGEGFGWGDDFSRPAGPLRRAPTKCWGRKRPAEEKATKNEFEAP